jgi:uncharacterized membrane protein YczE
MISFFTLLTDDFQINVYNISSIFLIISILGFGSAIKRWLSVKTGISPGEKLRLLFWE